MNEVVIKASPGKLILNYRRGCRLALPGVLLLSALSRVVLPGPIGCDFGIWNGSGVIVSRSVADWSIGSVEACCSMSFILGCARKVEINLLRLTIAWNVLIALSSIGAASTYSLCLALGVSSSLQCIGQVAPSCALIGVFVLTCFRLFNTDTLVRRENALQGENQ